MSFRYSILIFVSCPCFNLSFVFVAYDVQAKTRSSAWLASRPRPLPIPGAIFTLSGQRFSVWKVFCYGISLFGTQRVAVGALKLLSIHVFGGACNTKKIDLWSWPAMCY